MNDWIKMGEMRGRIDFLEKTLEEIQREAISHTLISSFLSVSDYEVTLNIIAEKAKTALKKS